MIRLEKGSWLGKWSLTGLGIFAALASGTAWGITLEVAESPTTSLSLTVSAIQSARQSILLNIYELSSSDVADALMAKIRTGVHVEIIEEGQPVGGVSAAARGIQAQLAQAMQSASNGDHLYEMTSHAAGVTGRQGAKRRYRYDHAKYAVIDGQNLLIGSENYSPTGNPQTGTQGNRGWEVFIHDADLAAEFAQIFRTDSNVSAGDLIDLTSSGLVAAAPIAELSPQGDFTVPMPTVPAPFAPCLTTLEASEVARVTAPDTSLSGLLALINGAQKSLSIEQMTFDPKWGKIGDTSPLLQAVMAAARRGVKVRVLLNDEQVFAHPGHPEASKNLPTIDALNQLADSEGLDVQARTANLKAMGVTYIHNKGALADDDKTLISSINWDSNAVLNNREAAVVITSPDVHAHYAALFDSDWSVSARAATPIGLVATETLREASGSPVSAFSDACPNRLRLSVQIGALRSSDPANTSFDSISNTRFTSDFVKAVGSHSCVLVDARASSRTGKDRFFEIRKKADGTRSAVLEGYTSDGKLYSIRTVLQEEGPYDGDYTSFVYDGSGPSREKLGEATLGIATEIGRLAGR